MVAWLGVHVSGGVRVRVRLPGGETRVLEVERGSRIADIVRRLGLIVEEVVVALDGEIVPEDERVYRESRIDVYSVVSGG